MKSWVIAGIIAVAFLTAGCSKDDSGPIDGWYKGSITVNGQSLPNQSFSITKSKLAASIPLPTGSGTATVPVTLNIELTGMTKHDNAELSSSHVNGTINGYGFNMANVTVTVEQIATATFKLTGDNTVCKLNSTSYHGFQGVITELPYTSPTLQLYINGTVTLSLQGGETTAPYPFTISLNAIKQ